MHVLIELYNKHKSDQLSEELLADNEKRRQVIIEALDAAPTNKPCPCQCKLYPNEQAMKDEKRCSVLYPALHAKKLTLTVDARHIHKQNDESAQKRRLEKFEEFV